ncbi:MAG: hypothetical protein HKN56_00855 [Gammaproteobacteria bacterium]|nr:hypothetical protein [Gammaproteobacteria bacterium]
MNQYSFRRVMVPVAGWFSCSAIAGPPMATDDAGVLAQGGWEYTLAYEAEQRDSGDSASAPSLEVAYGFNDELQGSVSIARATVDEPGSGSRSDFDAIGFEGKWQFYAQDNLSLAAVPSYSLPLTSSSTDRGIVDDVRVLSLPVVASWEQGAWTLGGQVAYEAASSGPNAWFGGIAGGYQASEALKLLAEVYQTRTVGADEDETNWTLGVDVAVAEGLAFLASVGGSLDSDLPDADELDQTWYLGFRYETR